MERCLRSTRNGKKQGDNQYVPMLQGGSIQICLHIYKIISGDYIRKLSSEEGYGRETLLFILCPSGLLGYFPKYELLLKNNNYFKN